MRDPPVEIATDGADSHRLIAADIGLERAHRFCLVRPLLGDVPELPHARRSCSFRSMCRFQRLDREPQPPGGAIPAFEITHAKFLAALLAEVGCSNQAEKTLGGLRLTRERRLETAWLAILVDTCHQTIRRIGIDDAAIARRNHDAGRDQIRGSRRDASIDFRLGADANVASGQPE